MSTTSDAFKLNHSCASTHQNEYPYFIIAL